MTKRPVKHHLVLKGLIFIIFFLAVPAGIILLEGRQDRKAPTVIAKVPTAIEMPDGLFPEPELTPLPKETPVPEQPVAQPETAPVEPVQNLSRDNAVPIAPKPGVAKIAIVFDDMGLDLRGTRRAVELKGPFTMSYIPYADNLPRQTAEARAHGHELMLHMPMQPVGKQNPGKGALTVDLSDEEIESRLRAALGRFDGMVGMNNHMGSRFTQYEHGLRIVMHVLKERGLLFLDSRTIGSSKAYDIARAEGVPALGRDVFLDDSDNPDSIRRQLRILEQVARRHGAAIAIGHPHSNTIAAVAEWERGLKEKGLQLVPVTDFIK